MNKKLKKGLIDKIKEEIDNSPQLNIALSELGDELEGHILDKETFSDLRKFIVGMIKQNGESAMLGAELTLEAVIKLIDEDITYQKKQLANNFGKDKAIKWRIIGFQALKKKLK